MLLDRFQRAGACCKVRHRIEPEVPHISLSGENETAKEDGRVGNHSRLWVDMDGEIYGFE